jgi:nucleoid-associated protein YgaU
MAMPTPTLDEPVAAPSETSIWVVQAGDTLSGIAAQRNGDASQWVRFLAANRDAWYSPT